MRATSKSVGIVSTSAKHNEEIKLGEFVILKAKRAEGNVD